MYELVCRLSLYLHYTHLGKTVNNDADIVEFIRVQLINVFYYEETALNTKYLYTFLFII